MRTETERRPDYAATATLLVVAIAALTAAWALPWWRMEARAPQYGQRVLVVEVSPRVVAGDVFELDALGHYVGIRPLGTLAHVERGMAPFGLALACMGLLVAPFLRRWWLRALALIPIILLPAVFLGDLDYWMNIGTNHRDPEAALNLTVKDINTKVVGRYDVGQFTVDAILSAGLFGAGTASLIGLGLIFCAPLPLPRRRAATTTTTALAGATAFLLVAAPARAGSLADAVAAAHDGDTIEVAAGVHHEHLTVDKRVVLRGQPGAILDGDDRGTVVRVTAAGAELRDLTIRNSGADYATEDAGVRIDHVAGVRLSGVRIEDTLFGVFAAQADRCVIERSNIVGKDLPHVRRGDGIRLWYSSGCRLTGNRVERSRDVVIWYSADTEVTDNVVRTSRYGLHFMYSDRNRFRGNRFEDNQVGAAIMYSHDIELRDNSFSYSSGPAAYGLLVKDADDVFVVGNRFIANDTALFFDGAPQSRGGRAEVRGNLIARNGVGMALEPLCRGVAVWENAFIGNRAQVQIMGTGSAEANRWSVGGRGNYWSDAVVYDPDGDGVSNLPYKLESTYEILADRVPALAFFDGTPGAEAIDLAARWFPLFAPRPKLTDEHPLARPALDGWLTQREEPRSPWLAAAGAALLGAAGLGARVRRWAS